MIAKLIKKLVLIVSDTSVIFDAVQDNVLPKQSLQIEFVRLCKPEDIAQYRKIDLLILNGDFPDQFPRHLIDSFVSIDNGNIDGDQIVLQRPFRLFQLLDIINHYREAEYIFCLINNQWVYNQKLSMIDDGKIKIKFTQKENQVFGGLLNAHDYSMSRAELLSRVWNYNHSSDSSTIESHLYRLKQKLPANLLQYKNNHYSLSILDIL